MIDLAQLPMRVGLGQFNELTDERLTFIKQCGCDDFLVNTPKLPGHEKWEFADLARWKAKADEAGLRWMAIENVPRTFYDEIMLGRPGRERQLTNMCETVRNMGQVGIPILGYNFMLNLVWRTSRETPGRGGALATSYDDSIASQATLEDQPRYTSAVGVADREYTEEEMWDNYDWYLERILPVCEEAGVQFALHPDDPPVKSLGGIARLFHSFDNFAHALDKFDSPFHGLDFCHGCWSEMREGAGVLDALRYFGERKRLFYIHFRDVQGSVENFTECFLGEGNCDPVETIRTLKDVGFHGFLIPDHVPRMIDDTEWCHRGRAWTVGYIQALLDAVDV